MNATNAMNKTTNTATPETYDCEGYQIVGTLKEGRNV